MNIHDIPLINTESGNFFYWRPLRYEGEREMQCELLKKN
jgi:hypothetical protein